MSKHRPVNGRIQVVVVVKNANRPYRLLAGLPAARVRRVLVTPRQGISVQMQVVLTLLVKAEAVRGTQTINQNHTTPPRGGNVVLRIE